MLRIWGGKRAEGVARLDERYGGGNWTIGYILDGRVLSRDDALKLYEQSYENFLRANPAITERLIREAKDIYDTAPSNVQSGLDYHKQEDTRSHLQDIAIRRALKNMGLSFQGEKLMQVRDVGSDFPELSPGKVPFVSPKSSIIKLRPYVADWVEKGSVEDFWQNNKFVFVRNEEGVLGSIRTHLESKLSAGTGEDRKEIEDTLLTVILMGAGGRELTTSYLDFLTRNNLQRERLPCGIQASTAYGFLNKVFNALPEVILTRGWGSEEVVRTVESLTPLFNHLPSQDRALDFLVSIDERVTSALEPATLCAFLHYLEQYDWPTKGNLGAFYTRERALVAIEQDPHLRRYLKTAPFIRKSEAEIREIVMKDPWAEKYHEDRSRLLAVMLDLKKEVEQGK